ncbi:MAG TPA: hypothetical protein VK171_14360, partial [Fimbriimonas sp.]|nr:hypothetical protein [Fimbriimonas sp.]
MNKKTGVLIAVVVGIFLLCFTGGALFIKNAFQHVTEAVEKSTVFGKSAISDIGAEWSLDTYLVYADEFYKTESEKTKAKLMLAEFSKRLGKLKSLDAVEPVAKGARSVYEGDRAGFYVRVQTTGTFEKGKAKITVAVRNHKEKQSLTEIQ